MNNHLIRILNSVINKEQIEPQKIELRDLCLICNSELNRSNLYKEFRVCDKCNFHYSISARDRINLLSDEDSFEEFNQSLSSIDPIKFSSNNSYKERLIKDQNRTGLSEAVITGKCTIDGNPVILIVLDFGFMGGTISSVVGEKVALGFEKASKLTLPVISIISSGGSRYQEGILSLMQMAKTTISLQNHASKNLPFISILTNPATGQAFASFANLADIILAEPGSIIGFSPVRHLQPESNSDNESINTAESHFENGMIDAIVDRKEQKKIIGTLLDLLTAEYKLESKTKSSTMPIKTKQSNGWKSIQISRHTSRPSSIDYIIRILNDFIEIHGDKYYKDDENIIVGIGHLGSQTVVIIAQDRNRGNNGSTSPEGFRKAQRGIKLASKFNLPLITLVDTPGPNSNESTEQRGLGHSIATTLSEMISLEVPSISAIIGEGGNSGALAIGVSDKILMMENAIYTVISPENAAEILYQDKNRAEEASQSLKITANDCFNLGIIDIVIPEPSGGAHTNPDEAARQLRKYLLKELSGLYSISKRRRLKSRYKRFRKVGEYSSSFKISLSREITSIQKTILSKMKKSTTTKDNN